MKETHADLLLQNVITLLKELRKEKGLSHEKLAKQSQVTRAAISHIENGNRKPSLLVCLRIADALGVSLAQVLVEAENRLGKL